MLYNNEWAKDDHELTSKIFRKKEVTAYFKVLA
jgi:hypothetical protein